jgi:hypothetical protein
MGNNYEIWSIGKLTIVHVPPHGDTYSSTLEANPAAPEKDLVLLIGINY